MLASTVLISLGVKPVAVLLCFGLENAGPTGPVRLSKGADIEGRRWRWASSVAMVAAAADVQVRKSAWADGQKGADGRSLSAWEVESWRGLDGGRRLKEGSLTRPASTNLQPEAWATILLHPAQTRLGGIRAGSLPRLHRRCSTGNRMVVETAE